jgi:uncharacterized protein with PQ loop repeat
MYAIELTYITTSLASVFTAVPQLRKLWSIKNSDEFNLFTWVAWLVAQLSGLVYSISISSIPYLIVNILWVVFYVAMIGLILKYRGGKQLAYAKAESISPIEK